MTIPINLPLTPIELLLSFPSRQSSAPWPSHFCTKGLCLYIFFGWRKYDSSSFSTLTKHLLWNRLINHYQNISRKRARALTTMKQSSTTWLFTARAMDQLQVLHTEKSKSQESFDVVHCVWVSLSSTTVASSWAHWSVVWDWFVQFELSLWHYP